MAQAHTTYTEQLSAEIRQVPDEYMPALLTIVHAFREGVVQKTFEQELQEGLRDAKSGKTFPIETLWD